MILVINIDGNQKIVQLEDVHSSCPPLGCLVGIVTCHKLAVAKIAATTAEKYDVNSGGGENDRKKSNNT
jgi:hypothetical protein